MSDEKKPELSYGAGGTSPINDIPVYLQELSNLVDGGNLSREIRKAIPDTETVMPCPTPTLTICTYHNEPIKKSLWGMVIHLNDIHDWERERIADWLESLDVDLAFPVPETVPKEPGEL